jgi:hypothetical protein
VVILKSSSSLQKEVADGLFSRKMAFMEWISRAIDKLPIWAKLIFYGLTVLGSVYCIAHYGFWSFLLHALFSP